MTVLGEFALPLAQPVWTSTLLQVLALFEIEQKAARQALARMAGEGWLASERVGRRVRWSLTKPGRTLLTEGAARIYAFGREREPWDERWLILLVSVPESQRDLRHRVRTRLNWAGFGSPAPGIWVSPDTGRQAEAQRIVSDLDVGSPAISFLATCGDIGDQDAMVGRSWDLRALEERYENFVDEFAGVDPSGERAVLQAQIRLVHEWRRFPFLDPQLPVALLPASWSGTKAAEVFHGKHAEWRGTAQQCWEDLASAEPPA